MIEDMFFCVISIVVGGYLVSQKLRAIYNRLPLSLKDKISFGEGLILIISGFIALYVKSAIPINALLFGCFLLPKMYQQEKYWNARRFTTAYIMHCSGWIYYVVHNIINPTATMHYVCGCKTTSIPILFLLIHFRK